MLVREPAERVVRRRDRVAREARVAAAVSVGIIAVRLLLEVRRALRGGDPGDEVRRVVGIALPPELFTEEKYEISYSEYLYSLSL